MKQDCWMAVLDLKEVCNLVPIAREHRKHRRFQFDNTLDEFSGSPNGLSSAATVFTKLLKPVYSILREKGIMVVFYTDDILLLANSPEKLETDIAGTINLLQSLEFTIHDTKSTLKPSQEVQFLGFILNSIKLVVSMVPHKGNKTRLACQRLTTKPDLTIRKVTLVVGILVSSFPEVTYGPFSKAKVLKHNCGDLDSPIRLFNTAKIDLELW